jgi:hypothetical protein
MGDGDESVGGVATTPADVSYSGEIDQSVGGTLVALQTGADQKIIADAQLDIEVQPGEFQAAFTQALLLADRYGGYVVMSSSEASGEDDAMKSGVVSIRIPAGSFDNAVSDAGGLGELKDQVITTQDVTEEFVDLEAHIVIAEARVDALLELMDKAETVQDILTVQEYLTAAQGELEALKGRLRYLDEHTSYSTVTMTIHEVGVEVVTAEGWGTVDSLRSALHNLVGAFNAIVRGLGVLVPILVVLAIVGLIVYFIWRRVAKRRRGQEQAAHQPQYGWGQPMQTGPAGRAGAEQIDAPQSEPPAGSPGRPTS